MPETLVFKPILDSTSTSTLASPLTNILFRQLIKTSIENARDQALFKSKEDVFDKLLKAKNTDLYYENLYIEYYYFCQ